LIETNSKEFEFSRIKITLGAKNGN